MSCVTVLVVMSIQYITSKLRVSQSVSHLQDARLAEAAGTTDLVGFE